MSNYKKICNLEYCKRHSKCIFHNAESTLKANAYEVSLGADKHSGILVCYQKEDIGLKEESKPEQIVVKQPIIKRVEDSDDSWEVHLTLQKNKGQQPHCQNPNCKSVANERYINRINLCHKCIALILENRSQYELAKYFNSKPKILNLLSVIYELNNPKEKVVIRCINIYCGTQENITKHHLIPKPYRKGIVGKIDTVPLCDPCHKRVHRLKTNGELAQDFNTKEAIIKLLASDVSFRVMRVLSTQDEQTQLAVA